MLEGRTIAGAKTKRDRVENDFYATPKSSTLALLSIEELIFPVWECACGQGHISKVIESYYNVSIVSSDLIDRGYGITPVDFLKLSKDNLPESFKGINTIITNPPFALFLYFIKKGLELTNRKLILFGKIQALEGVERATFIQKSPLRYVYVFKKRQSPLRNGSSVDENGKEWNSTMCFCWFVWDKEHTGEPIIRWL